MNALEGQPRSKLDGAGAAGAEHLEDAPGRLHEAVRVSQVAAIAGQVGQVQAVEALPESGELPSLAE